MLWDELEAVLVTPPPIPTGLQESSRILLDSNKISKKAFSHIVSFPPTGLLLDSYWIPTGLQLNLNKYHKLNAMGQILDSYWSPTGVSYNLSLLTPNQLT